jgi:hypothetical protein
MLKPNSNAFDKITNLANASLQKLPDISKLRFKFFSTVFELERQFEKHPIESLRDRNKFDTFI